MKAIKRLYLIGSFVVLIFCTLSVSASADDVFRILLVPLDKDEGGFVSKLIAKRISDYRLEEIKIEIVEEWRGLRPEQEFGSDLQPRELLERLRDADADLLITGELVEEGDRHTAKLWLWPRYVDSSSAFAFPISPTDVPIIPKRRYAGLNLPVLIYRAVPHKFTQASHPLIWGEAMYFAATAFQSLDTCAPIGNSLRFEAALTAGLDWPPQSECDTDLLYHARSRISAARPVFSLKESPEDKLKLENRSAELSLFIGLREDDSEALRLVPEAMRLINGLAKANGQDGRYGFDSAVYDLVVGSKLRNSALLRSSIKQFEKQKCSDPGVRDFVCQIGKTNAAIHLAIIEANKDEYLKNIRKYRELYQVLKNKTSNTAIHFLTDIGMATALMEGGTAFGREDIVAEGLSIMKQVTVNFGHPKNWSMHNRIMEIIDTYDG